MTDSTFNRFLSYGTAAQRAAFTPSPPTPASGPSPGYIWRETDTGYTWFYDTTWHQITGANPLYPFITPVDGSFAWLNQGGASVTVNANGGIFLRAPTSAGDNIRGRTVAAPGATPYTVTAAFLVDALSLNFQNAGIIFYDSGSGKVNEYGFAGDATALNNSFIVQHFNSVTSFNAATYTQAALHFGGVIWLRVTDDGTNRKFYYGTDGYNFIQLHSEGRTVFLTANTVGYYVNNINATYEAGATLLSWAIT